MKVFIKGLVLELEIPGNRYLAHSLLNEYADDFIRNYPFDFDDSEEEEFNESIQELHDKISAEDYKGIETHEVGGDFYMEWNNPFQVIEKELYEVLEESGYNVERSKTSGSLYVDVDGKELRISDHKRPAYPASNEFDLQEHVYDMEIINENNQVSKKQLENLGLEIKSDESVFYF